MKPSATSALGYRGEVMVALLDVRELTMRFGGLAALDGVSLSVDPGEIRGLIGPNGAGKTTFFNLVTGVLTPTSGHVVFDGNDITGRKPHRIARAGIARTFQNIRLFGAMTVLENVMVGADAHNHSGILDAIFRTPRNRRTEREAAGRAGEMLELMGIARLRNELAHNLSYGDQRRVEIARALATRPRLLMLDEPTAGMNPSEKASITALIGKIRETGVTVLLIEHDVKLVMGVSERVSVLDFGQKIAEGTPEEVQRDPKVIEAYLGRPATAG